MMVFRLLRLMLIYYVIPNMCNAFRVTLPKVPKSIHEVHDALSKIKYLIILMK